MPTYISTKSLKKQEWEFECVEKMFKQCQFEYAFGEKDEGITDCDICGNFHECQAFWGDYVVSTHPIDYMETVIETLAQLRRIKYGYYK